MDTIWQFVRVPLLLFGAFMTASVTWAHVEILPTFTSSRYKAFWDDAVAYHLKSDGHKTLEQLYAEYDPARVRRDIVGRGAPPALVPSEKSAKAFWVGMTMEDATGDPPRRSAKWLLAAPFVFPVVLIPLMMFVGLLTRNIAWALCQSGRPAALFAKHHEVPFRRRAISALVALPVVIGLAALSAYQDWTPEMKRAGYTLADLTIIGVVQSYLGGTVVRFVRGLIDAGFLAAGIDPERVMWDDLAAVAVMAPVLILLYDNSLVGILADLVAGVGPGLLVKLWQRRRPTPPTAEALEGAAEATRNWWLAGVAGVIGGIFFVCGGGVGLIVRDETAPTRIAAADLEAKGVPRRVRWVAVDDGYLFWPLLAAVPHQDDPKKVERYVVPLVSRATRDAWLAERDKGKDARYRSDGTRALVAFFEKDLQRLFPGVVPGKFPKDRPWAAHAVNGRVSKLSGERERYRRAVRPGDVAESAAVVIENDDQPISSRGLMLAIALVGLVALLPLPLRWLLTRRPSWRPPPPPPPIPKPRQRR